MTQPTPIGHEYVGIVEEVGSDVRLIEPGQFVVGSFFASDSTCRVNVLWAMLRGGRIHEDRAATAA